jgi:hypothetical protein
VDSVNQLGELVPDRGSPPPAVVSLGLARLTMASGSSGQDDLGPLMPDRGAPPPATASVATVGGGMSLALEGEQLGPLSPDRGDPLPVAVTLSDSGGPTTDMLFAVVREVSELRVGADGYGAVVIDPPSDEGEGEGVRAGLLLFGQASGDLGGVLRLMHQRDPAAFEQVFGPASGELLAVTGAASRSERLGSVGGELLWSPTWVARLAAAGVAPTYRYAQNEYAVEHLVRPLIGVAERYGLGALAGVAVALERSIALGRDAALRWLDRVLCGPTSTDPPATRLRAATAGLDRSTMERLLSALAGPANTAVLGPQST